MGKFDVLLKKAEMFEKLAVYGDRKSFLQALSQEDPWAAVRQKLEEERGLPPATIPPPPPASTQPAAQPSAAPAPAATSHQSFPLEAQDQLNKILLPYEKIAVPLKLDGKLGPETQKALEAFRQTYGKPGTPENIKEVYWQIKSRSEAPGFEHKTPKF